MDWPDLEEDLKLKCFKNLHLDIDNKKIGKDQHQPVNRAIPRRHILAHSLSKGDNSMSSSIKKLGESGFQGQVVVANAIMSAFGKKETVNTAMLEPYSIECHNNNDAKMSQLYHDPDMRMEEIMDHMWQKDRSDVFNFQEDVLGALQEKRWY